MMRVSLLLMVVMVASRTVMAETLVFNDEFDSLTEAWNHEISMSGGGNNEFQAYINNRTISFVKDGVLFIKPQIRYDDDYLSSGTVNLWGHLTYPNDACTDAANDGCLRTGTKSRILPPINSAKLTSSFSFKYGRLEARMKLPKGDWIWPALWLMPKYNLYGTWPASGEIDLMESRGNAPVHDFGTTLHFGPDYRNDPWWTAHADYSSNMSLSDDFYVYGLEWNSSYMGSYIIVDNKRIDILKTVIKTSSKSFFYDLCQCPTCYNPYLGSGVNAPFDQKFYIIINVAVGGTNGYFPDSPDKPWVNSDPNAATSFLKARDRWSKTWSSTDSSLQIDWIRVYQ